MANFLTSWGTVSVSKWTLLPGVTLLLHPRPGIWTNIALFEGSCSSPACLSGNGGTKMKMKC